MTTEQLELLIWSKEKLRALQPLIGVPQVAELCRKGVAEVEHDLLRIEMLEDREKEDLKKADQAAHLAAGKER